MAKLCTLEAVKSGTVTLADLQEMNAILEMQSDIQDQAMDDAKEENKKNQNERRR